MKYVDGFVLRVPKSKFKEYKKMASAASKVWKKHGALEYFECRGDDLNHKMEGVKLLSFSKMTGVKTNEDVWFSFIIYKSKKHRDSINAKVMKEFEKDKNQNMKMPFDVSKMAYGGFQSVVER
jgi:alkaline phosphatase